MIRTRDRRREEVGMAVTGREIAALLIFRRLPLARRRDLLAALRMDAEGVPFEEAMAWFLTEEGHSIVDARQMVDAALSDSSASARWQDKLN
jgi:hypothetical protein